MTPKHSDVQKLYLGLEHSIQLMGEDSQPDSVLATAEMLKWVLTGECNDVMKESINDFIKIGNRIIQTN